MHSCRHTTGLSLVRAHDSAPPKTPWPTSQRQPRQLTLPPRHRPSCRSRPISRSPYKTFTPNSRSSRSRGRSRRIARSRQRAPSFGCVRRRCLSDASRVSDLLRHAARCRSAWIGSHRGAYLVSLMSLSHGRSPPGPRAAAASGRPTRAACASSFSSDSLARRTSVGRTGRAQLRLLMVRTLRYPGMLATGLGGCTEEG